MPRLISLFCIQSGDSPIETPEAARMANRPHNVGSIISTDERSESFDFPSVNA